MAEADDVIEMHQDQEVDGEYVVGKRVKRFENQVRGSRTDNIGLDSNGDWEIVTRVLITERPGWVRYTIRKVS
jgi:hypothetical protein